MDPSEMAGFAEDHFEDGVHAYSLMKELNVMSNVELINYVLENSKRNELNGVTSYFPAYDVAENVKNNHWQLTVKQRHAITNVYLFMCFGWKQEGLLNRFSK